MNNAGFEPAGGRRPMAQLILIILASSLIALAIGYVSGADGFKIMIQVIVAICSLFGIVLLSIYIANKRWEKNNHLDAQLQQTYAQFSLKDLKGYTNDIKEKIKALEKERIEVHSRRAVIVPIVIFGLFVGQFIPVIPILILVWALFRFPKRDQHVLESIYNRYKEIIVPLIFRSKYQSLEIYPNKSILKESIIESKLVGPSFMNFFGEDLLEFHEFGDLKISEFKDQKNKHIGIFATAQFPFVLDGHTLVFSQNKSTNQREKFIRVILESSEFHESYSVYSSHGASARLAMRTDIMYALIKYAKEGKTIELAFVNNRIYFWMPFQSNKESLFEFNHYRSLLSDENSFQTHSSIEIIVDLINLFKLDQNT